MSPHDANEWDDKKVLYPLPVQRLRRKNIRNGKVRIETDWNKSTIKTERDFVPALAQDLQVHYDAAETASCNCKFVGSQTIDAYCNQLSLVVGQLRSCNSYEREAMSFRQTDIDGASYRIVKLCLHVCFS